MAAAKQNGQAKNTKQKTVAEDLFDALNPNTMLNNAQRVLSSAVNVLEEEIAAGILAAKKIEKKIINVDDVRGDNENLANRLRKDAHEVVDLLIDGLIAVTNQLKNLSGTIDTTNDALKKTATTTQTKEPAIATLQPDAPVKAGGTVTLFMQLSNDASTEAVRIALKKTDLLGSSTQKILSRYIEINPSTVVLEPLENKEIIIQIKIPATCKAGHYTALFVDELDPKTKALISLEVL